MDILWESFATLLAAQKQDSQALLMSARQDSDWGGWRGVALHLVLKFKARIRLAIYIVQLAAANCH